MSYKMSVLQQRVEIFVTHVAAEGPLLRLWAQLERTQATFVERLILQLTEQFERGLGIPSSVEVGQLCCARYSDGVYYRARVTSKEDISRGRIDVHFIDYGNSEEISVRDIRSLEESMLTPLASVNDQATDFYLAGVIPLTGQWNEACLTFIRQTICYEELKCMIVGQVANKKLLRVIYNNEDFAQILITKSVGVAISIPSQQILLQGYYGLNSVPPQFPGFNIPPPPPTRVLNQLQTQVVTLPPVPPIRMENMSGSTPAMRETVRVFTSPVLEVNSEHMVYVSYVEDGPSSFAVQLQAAEETLSLIMESMNSPPPMPLSQPLMPGSVCVGRFTEDQTLCRAVVMAVLDDKCRLYYVDFGNSEILPFSEIFELPQQLINPKVMALRFTLAGLKNLIITDDIKSYFKELVTEKLLCLRVVPPEVSPVKQYGELYLNGTSILDLLIQKIREKQAVPLSYSVMPVPPTGSRDTVKVSYVINTSNFYVQLEVNTEALKSVMLAIDTVCSGTAEYLKQNELKVGLPCCAQYNEDGKWYRAKILSLSSDFVEVMYVDYGNTDSVPLSSLKHIDPNLVKILKLQAIPCCLSGFQGNIDEELAVKFEEITLGKTFTLVVMDKLQDNVLVELYDGSSGSHVNVSSQLLVNETVVEAVKIQDHFIHPTEKKGVRNSPSEPDDWQESVTEASEMSYRGNQHERKQNWNRDAERSTYRALRSQPRYREALPSLKGLSWRYCHGKQRKPDENENEWRPRKDERDGGSGSKSWQNKDISNWRYEDGNRRGKRGGQGDGEQSGKWSSHGGDEQRGKFWPDNHSANGSGYSGDVKKKSWNRDENGSNRSGNGRWNTDEVGGRRRKWNDKDDGSGGDFSGGGRRNKWRDENEDSWRGGGTSDNSNKWKSTRTDDHKAGPRGGQKSWANHDQSGRSLGHQKKIQHEDVTGEIWEDKTSVTNAGTIPEASIQVGDVKCVEVVFLASPGEFCVQVISESVKLSTVMEGIAATYGAGGGNPLPRTNLKNGTACVARYSEDGSLYRAIIESVNTDSAVVLFCDYGNREEVPLDELKEISFEYLNLPVQGLLCKLLAANPQEGVSWSEEEITNFTTVTDGRNLQAHFMGKTNGLYEVVLEDSEKGNRINEQFGASNKVVQAAFSSEGVKSSAKVLHTDSESYELASPDQRYLIQTMAPETLNDIFITWFINPEDFYCQLQSSEAAIKDMMKMIQSAYRDRPSITSSVQVGSPVIAKFMSDGVLYRAEVKEVSSLSLIVEFVDYGNCDLVSRNNMWDIESRFMTLPRQALHCCLRGVKSTNSEWPRAVSSLDKHFEEQKFHCTFHDSEQHKYNVSLTTLEGKNVADDLVADGLAVSQAIHSESVKSTDIVEEPLDLSLLPGQILVAHVTYVEGIAKFFVHLKPAIANNIQTLVDEYVQNPENMLPVETKNLTVNSLCLATPDSAQWYRGKIIDCTRTTGVFIKFIDFGDGDEIPLDKVIAIPSALEQYAEQAIECCISGSSNTTVSAEVEDQFKANFEDTDVMLKVNSVEEDRLFVSMFNMEGKMLQLLKSFDNEPLTEVEAVCPLPVMSKKIKMWVTHIDGPDCLWLQRVSDTDNLAELLEKLYSIYESEVKDDDFEPLESKFCAAKSTSDEQWYRGKILNVNSDEKTCSVLFIDYGNSESIPLAQVKTLDATLLIPHAFAVCTSLAMVCEQNEKLSTTLCEMTTEKEFTVIFCLKENNKWIVDLFENNVSVSKKLMELGLGKDLKDHLFHSEIVADHQTEVLKKGTSFPVFISHFDSPCSFWVQKAEDFEIITALQYELQTSADILETFTSVPEVGTKCVGIFDETWYRAVILERNSVSATVRFIDFGIEDVVDIASEGLKILPDKLGEIPVKAERCSLFESSELKLSVELAHRMASLVEETEEPVIAHVLKDGEIKLVGLKLADGRDVLEVLCSEELAIEEAAANSVYVSHFNSPSEFWIQYASNSNQLEEIESRMLETTSFPILEEAFEGALCAAMFSEQWYRAKILKSKNEEFNMFFIDYGNSSTSLELRSLPEDLINIPPLAKQCSLYMPVSVTEWSEAAKAKFVERVEGGFTEFQVTILEEKESYAVVSLLEDGHKLEEEMLALQTEGKMSVVSLLEDGHKLEEEMLALQTEGKMSVVSLLEDGHKLEEEMLALQTEGKMSIVSLLEDGHKLEEEMLTLKTEGKMSVVSLLEDGHKQEEEMLTLKTEGKMSVVSLLEDGPKLEEDLQTENKIPVTYTELTILHASICHVASPSNFWIRLENFSTQFDEISDLLVHSEDFPTLDDIEENVFCVASFPEDGKWYRAKTLALCEEGIEVMYVDFGNTAISTEFRQLPQDLKHIPPLAKKCCLPVPCNMSEWPESVSDKFLGIVGDTTKLFDVEIIKDGDPAVICIWNDGKKIEEELLEVSEIKSGTVEIFKNECSSKEMEGNISESFGREIVGNNVEDLNKDDIKEVMEEVTENEKMGIFVNYNNLEGDINTDTAHISECESMEQMQFYDAEAQGVSKENEMNIVTKCFDSEVTKGDVTAKEDQHENESVEHIEISETIVEQNKISDTPNEDIIGNLQYALNEQNQLEDFNGEEDLPDENKLNIEDIILENVHGFKTQIESSSTANTKESKRTETVNTGETTMKSDDENGSDDGIVESTHELYAQKTKHTEKLVREISVNMKTPNDEVVAISKTLPSSLDSHCEKIIPACVSRGISEEELQETIRSTSPKLTHAEKIVPGSISRGTFNDIKKDDGVKSEPSTPLVSRSENFLQRTSSHEALIQRTPSSPKITHNNRIVPGCISRGESQEEIRPPTPKLTHGERIVPGSISRGISDEILVVIESEQIVTSTVGRRTTRDVPTDEPNEDGSTDKVETMTSLPPPQERDLD